MGRAREGVAAGQAHSRGQGKLLPGLGVDPSGKHGDNRTQAREEEVQGGGGSERPPTPGLTSGELVFSLKS